MSCRICHKVPASGCLCSKHLAQWWTSCEGLRAHHWRRYDSIDGEQKAQRALVDFIERVQAEEQNTQRGA